ncbi:MAG: polyphosphate polymerase domain-containing protein [Actinomycetota bacterium]|nr:polyphosphate polymerase domain-containing protein [Actinomycetota bacterium]
MTTHDDEWRDDPVDDVLRRLRPVSLDALVSTADLQTRRDRKYVVPRAIVADLVEALAAHAGVLTIDGRRSFRYESVYFDTPGLTSYLGAARRRPDRFKVRTRTYLDAGRSMLEVKTRDRRGRTVKRRRPHAPEDGTRLSPGDRRFAADAAGIGVDADRLRPTLRTRYRRTTLVVETRRPATDTNGGYGRSDTARVTVDTDLTIEGLDGLLGGDTRSAAFSDLAIVETKSAGPATIVDRFLWGRGYRPATISKYGTGLAYLRPRLPANKWHRVLQLRLRPRRRRPATHLRPGAPPTAARAPETPPDTLVVGSRPRHAGAA